MTVAAWGTVAGSAAWAIAAVAPRPAPPPAPVVVPLVAVVPIVLAPPEAPVAAPPTPPTPPTLPPPDLAEPVIGTTCPVDVTNLGVPLGLVAASDAWQPADGAVTTDGGTIAAWSADSIAVSWDGGQTFERRERAAAEAVAVASGRLVMIRERTQLGVLRPGRPLTWRAFDLPRREQDGLLLLAAGQWTVVIAGKLVAASSDDGATWIYLPAPAAPHEAALTPGGRLELRVFDVDAVSDASDDSPPAENITRRHVTYLGHPRWRTLGPSRGRLLTTGQGWTYLIRNEEDWGCGGTSMLVATSGGRSMKLAGGHNSMAYNLPFSVKTGPAVAFAQVRDRLFQLDGARMSDRGDIEGQLIGVDASGTAIALAGERVLRWSAGGGWRVLLDAPRP